MLGYWLITYVKILLANIVYAKEIIGKCCVCCRILANSKARILFANFIHATILLANAIMLGCNRLIYLCIIV